MITRRPLLLGVAASGAALSLVAGRAFAQGIPEFLGEWHGVLDLGSQRLRLRLVVSEGPRATLYSVDQGNAEIPAAETTINGDAISITFPVIGASYQGRLAGGRIEGQFIQRAALPLVFTREDVATDAAAPEALTQARLAALRAEAGAPAFAVAANSGQGHAIAFVDGVRALGRPAPITTNDYWHWGSITKSMTATLVARCVEAGAVNWDDTVGGVLGGAIPDMRDVYRDVNFRHLLSHRAGLQSNLEMEQIMAFPRESADARADRVAYARLGLQQEPVGPKEQSFEYSNTGYVIAGAMLEAKLAAPWESLIRERVFAPLGMASAGQGAPGTLGAYDQPVGHALNVAGVLEPHPLGSPITDNPVVIGPAGRVHSSMDDMFKFLRAHCESRTPFLRRESWAALHAPPFGGPYAMGLVQRNGALWHNGSNTLWYAEVLIDPARGIVAAAATNDGRAGEMGRPIGAALIGAAQAVV